MIILRLYSDTHIALAGSYEYRTQIKGLADWPDVRFDSDAHAWLVHVALIEKLYEALGDFIAPASPDFWCKCPLYQPAPVKRRRTKQEIVKEKRVQKAAAGRFGRIMVDAMHGEVR